MPCFSPLKGYKDPISGGWTSKPQLQKMEVACSQCLGCRIDHRTMWAIRIVHESYLWLDHHGNSWLTLTYREKHDCTPEQLKAGHYVPDDLSLVPSHVSKFIRALRKKRTYKYAEDENGELYVTNPIRYFYCGEYGDENQRPHYHVCLFNHQFHDRVLWRDIEGVYTYTSPTLEKLWPYGFSTTGELNFETAAYTAGYCFKKITGKRARDHYLRCDEYGVAFWLHPEFTRMSTGRGKPSGLGAKYYEKFKSDIFPADETPVPGHGTVQLVPRYYQDVLKQSDPDLLELVKQQRQQWLAKHRNDFTPERLRDKYRCAQAKQNLKKRNL